MKTKTKLKAGSVDFKKSEIIVNSDGTSGEHDYDLGMSLPIAPVCQ